jgi:hypothetical protein
MTSQMQPEPESELDKLLKMIRESENILQSIRLAAIVEGIDVGQCKCRMMDMLEDLLRKASSSTQHQKQGLEFHRYFMKDIRQHDSSLQYCDSQECIQTIINSTMGGTIGRAASVIDVVAERRRGDRCGGETVRRQ